MTWNHRVVKKKDPASGEDFFQIHEAYYFNGKVSVKPKALTLNAITPYGESLDDLKWVLDVMRKACDAPVIDHTKKGDISPKERIEQAFLDAHCAAYWALKDLISEDDESNQAALKEELNNLEHLKLVFLTFVDYMKSESKKNKKVKNGRKANKRRSSKNK